jgi:hypothetical protein
LTWKKPVKRDLKDWSITKELAMDRGKRKTCSSPAWFEKKN